MLLDNLNVDEEIIKILKEANINKLTQIQEEVIPHILNGVDILGVSHTGTGKTLAFLIPIINNLLKVNKSMYCLIIAPTRELALQINKSVQLFVSIGIRSQVLIGGEKIEIQLDGLNKHPHIVIGTPGRIHRVGGRLHLNRFKILILDEADKYFENDYIEEMKFVFENIRKRRQTLMFTATLTENVKVQGGLHLRKPKLINLVEKSKVEKLDEFYIFIGRRYKEAFLFTFLSDKSDLKKLIFVNMKNTSVIVSKLLNKLGVPCEYLNGSQEQLIRRNVLEGFIKDKYNVLVTTDVGSRGLDICDIDMVINYDIPQSSKDYIHRIGRTARAGKEGYAISLITQYDVPQFQYLEHVLGKKIPEYEYYGEYKQAEECVEDAKIEILHEIKNDSEK